MTSTTIRDLDVLPSDLPVPEDDGASRHLEGTQLPDLTLPSTTGAAIALRGLTTVLFAYPRTGQPGKQPLVPEWDQIAGARGCTPQVCGFRDELDRIRSRGFLVHGVSTQSPSYQAEAAARLHLTFPLLSDESLVLTHALKLPVFTVADQILMKRLALVIVNGLIRKVFYPVFPPDQNASVVIDWLEANAVEA